MHSSFCSLANRRVCLCRIMIRILIMIGGAAGVKEQQTSLAICIIIECHSIFCRNTISLMEDLMFSLQPLLIYFIICHSKLSSLSLPSKFQSRSVMALRRTCNLNQLFLSALPIIIARGHFCALGQLCSPLQPIHLRASPLRI